jgi:prepilin-type N-terminal cleavage/methylation domain-containing protein
MKQSGFTLIELLVVIAIIGILSSVVMASLNTARNKGKQATLKSEALQLRNLLEFEYTDTGSYANLTKGWIGGGSVNGQTTCAARGYAGNYASQVVAICDKIWSILGASYSQMFLMSGTGSTFSVMVRYPNGTMYCVGSSGKTSDNVPYTTPGLSYPGCYSNP